MTGSAWARAASPTRRPAGLVPYLFAWLVSGLAFAVLSIAFSAVLGLVGLSPLLGPVSTLLNVLQVALPAAAGVAVLRRPALGRGVLAWVAAGMPAPVLLSVVNLVRWGPTVRETLGAQAGGVQVMVLVIAVAGALLGAVVTGVLRTRRTAGAGS